MTDLLAPDVGYPTIDNELPKADGLRLRPRRPARALLAVLLVVASVAVTLTIYVRIGDRREVLAVTRTVLAGEQLGADDFRVIAISTDDHLASVSAAERDVLVGQYAKVRIAAGSLMVESSVQGQPLVSADRVLMSVSVPVGGVPRGLREGSRVALIVKPRDQSADAQPVLVEATIAAVPTNLGELVDGGSSTSTEVALSVEVPPDRAALVGLADEVAVGVIDPSAPFPFVQVSG